MLFRSKDKPVNPLRCKGFPICPYYAIRAHIRNPGPPERRRCENGQQYAWALRRGLHPPHLYPRHQAAAESSGRDNRKFHGAGHVDYVEQKKQQKSQTGKQNFLSGTLCPSPNISACGSRCGSTKNRKNKLTQKVVKTKEIPPESMDSGGILELLPRFELGTSNS